PRADLLTDLEREGDVRAGRRRAVVPLRVRMQLPGHVHGAFGVRTPGALLDRRQLGCEPRLVLSAARGDRQVVVQDPRDVARTAGREAATAGTVLIQRVA